MSRQGARPPSPALSRTLSDKLRVSRLLDVYGPLLSDHQRECLELHHNEDLSLTEIGERLLVSRQAVHDAVRHGRESLERHEAALGLLDRRDRQAERVAQLRDAVQELRELTQQPGMVDPGALREIITQIQECLDGI